MEEKLNRWKYMYEIYPEIMIQNLRYKISLRCGHLPPSSFIPKRLSHIELRDMYPNEHGNLYVLFDRDINDWSVYLIQRYGCNPLREDFNNLPYFIETSFSIHRDSQSGGKFTYKGRKYVIRQGERSGKYILVKGKKVYLSQL